MVKKVYYQDYPVTSELSLQTFLDTEIVIFSSKEKDLFQHFILEKEDIEDLVNELNKFLKTIKQKQK